MADVSIPLAVLNNDNGYSVTPKYTLNKTNKCRKNTFPGSVITFAPFLILHQLEAVVATAVEATEKVRARVSATAVVRVTLIHICNGRMLHK